MTRTNKILAAVVAVGLAVGAFYFFALAPKREEIAKLDTDVAAKEAELAQAQQTLAGYEQARKTYRSNYTTLARLGKAVPADDDVRSLMVQLQSAAERSGVDFEKIELGTSLAGANGSAPAPGGEQPTGGELASAPGAVPVAGGAMSAMPFSFTFNGGFFDLSSFMSRLEHFVTVNNERVNVTGRLLRLESVSLAPAQTGFPNMQAQIGAATYIVPSVEPVSSDAPAAAAPPVTSQSASTPPSTTANAGGAQ
jgi:Tfp pilus assembly protein PilO